MAALPVGPAVRIRMLVLVNIVSLAVQDPSIKEMAEQLVKDPAFAQVTETLKQRAAGQAAGSSAAAPPVAGTKQGLLQYKLCRVGRLCVST